MAYDDALQIASSETGSRADLAIDLLANANGVVVLDSVLALRPEPDRILCEVFASPSTVPGKYEAVAESAKEFLAQSTIFKALPVKPLSWLVVYDYGKGVVVLWRAS